MNDRIYRKQRQFLIHWKGEDEIDATWEPIGNLEGASYEIRDYWFKTYNQSLPFELPWTHNETFSNWTVQTPEYEALFPELDPEGFWRPIQDSEYSEVESLSAIEESELEE